MMNLRLILAALFAPLMGSTADPLVRAADLREGTVIFSYPGCEGLTGNAESIRFDRDGQSHGVFVHGLYSREDAAEDAVFGAGIAADDLAVPRLFDLARDRRANPGVRQEGLFWLAILAGDRAADTLRSAIDDEGEDLELREHAVFALTQLDEDRAFPLLMEIARAHPDPDVRNSSFLWLARYDRPEVVNLFEEILVGE